MGLFGEKKRDVRDLRGFEIVREVLGREVRDKVTGYAGVATSVAFDLYGCVQVVINPGMKKDGTLGDCGWFDLNRIEITNPAPVLELPGFVTEYGMTEEAIEEAEDAIHGPSEKPEIFKP